MIPRVPISLNWAGLVVIKISRRELELFVTRVGSVTICISSLAAKNSASLAFGLWVESRTMQFISPRIITSKFSHVA